MDLETAPEEIQPSSLWGARVADSTLDPATRKLHLKRASYVPTRASGDRFAPKPGTSPEKGVAKLRDMILMGGQ
jgi:hypothetical protein